MPSYSTIIEHLLRLQGDSSGSLPPLVRSTLRLYPTAEALSDAIIVDQELSNHARAWATAVAFEQLRGWRWPYWLNLQANPALPSTGGAAGSPVLHNAAARENLPLIQPQTGLFAGSIDRRGMVIPRDQRFGVELWCKIGDELLQPASVLDENRVGYGPGPTVAIAGNNGIFEISAATGSMQQLSHIKLTGRVRNVASSLPVIIYAAIRPYTTDGVSPVHDLVYNSKGFWMSDNRVVAIMPQRPALSWASDARHGDAAQFLHAPPERTAVRCAAGMATAISAFHFESDAGEKVSPANASGSALLSVEILLPLEPVYPREMPMAELLPGSSSSRSSTIHPRTASEPPINPGIVAMNGAATAMVEASLTQLLAATDVTSPVVTDMLSHRNHWIVPAVRALLVEQHPAAAARLLSYCLLGIQRNGYLAQGHGKWAFQGQALTALADFYRRTGSSLDETFARYASIRSMAKWIMRKRREVSHAPNKPAGIFPPGISRNGLGQDYHLVDNFWGIEGLQAASWLARQAGEHSDADDFHEDAQRFAKNIKAAIHRELEYGILQQVPGRLHRAYDATSAAELLDLCLMEEARAMLAPLEWYDNLIESLSGQLKGAPVTKGLPLLQVDSRGVFPARRLLLLMAGSRTEKSSARLLQEALSNHDAALTTPLLVWPEQVDILTQTGRGKLPFDPEAAALYILLARKLNPPANNQAT